MPPKLTETYKVICLFALVSLLAVELPVCAQYTHAEPKMDSSAEAGKIKPGTTLQGGVLKVEKHNKKPTKLMNGIKKGQKDSLKARIKDDGALKAQAQSSVGIIGVKFVAVQGKPPVINEVFMNTPADKVGLRIYDVIVAVDGVPTTGLTKDEVFDLIVGTPGTQVSLSILRNGNYSAVSCTRMDINELTDARVRRDYMIHF